MGLTPSMLRSLPNMQSIKTPTYDPVLEQLNVLLLDAGSTHLMIAHEVRRLCLLAFVTGIERGIAYAMHGAVTDEELDEATVADPE